MKNWILKLIDKNFKNATNQGLEKINVIFANKIFYGKPKQKIGFK